MYESGTITEVVGIWGSGACCRKAPSNWRFKLLSEPQARGQGRECFGGLRVWGWGLVILRIKG